MAALPDLRLAVDRILPGRPDSGRRSVRRCWAPRPGVTGSAAAAGIGENGHPALDAA
ncbi:MAG: hypothetical protein OXH96_00995 [Spirochaetaceae bacterium]|nr:hypothetical protein [Spirochaetaceae bacterium]